MTTTFCGPEEFRLLVGQTLTTAASTFYGAFGDAPREKEEAFTLLN